MEPPSHKKEGAYHRGSQRTLPPHSVPRSWVPATRLAALMTSIRSGRGWKSIRRPGNSLNYFTINDKALTIAATSWRIMGHAVPPCSTSLSPLAASCMQQLRKGEHPSQGGDED